MWMGIAWITIGLLFLWLNLRPPRRKLDFILSGIMIVGGITWFI